DFEALRFNTAISKLMVFVRDVAGEKRLSRTSAEALVLMLSPLAPHIAEELWHRLGHEQSLVHEKWPEADPEQLREDSVTLVVQVNGKRRGEIEVSTEASEDALRETALAVEAVQKHLEGRSPKKVIVVPGRLVNVVG
ncbi:MAG: class I tRNA ligase family protein, partial [bacterium]|nr:class I tRNA ligase family protein [bacterium]